MFAISGGISQMRYEARVTAYDVMDQVAIILVVRESTGFPAHGDEVVYHKVTTVAGTGESDAREWLKDALIAALETL
jgi:hypothetical protein